MRKFACGLLLSLFAAVGCGNVVIVSDTITPVGPVALDAGQSVTLTATVAGDSSNSGVTWQLMGSGTLSGQTTTTVVYTAPTGVTATGSGTVTATPVKNALYTAATVVNYSPAPVITTTALPGGTVGVPYNYQIVVSGGAAPLTITLVSGTLPAGLNLSAGGVLSGTPTAAASSTLVFRVTDSAATPASAMATLTLNVTGAPLSITTASTPNGVVGKAYGVTLASSGGVAPFTWSVASGALPAGLALSTGGVLSGTPSAAGSYSFTVKVVDTEPSPQTATKSYTLTIYSALAITTATLPNGSVKTAYSTTLGSTGGTLPVTWSLASGALPSGLTLSAAGVISGTPTAAGASTFSVQAADTSSPQQVATQSYTVMIVLSTLAITTTSLPNATATSPYSATLQSSGGNPPVTWSVSSGALPVGLTLSAAGVISGTTGNPGTYPFTVQATDTTPASVTQSLSITVVGLAALTVSTTTLPNGNIGTAYSSTLAATGGATPYVWSVASGVLPPGLALSAAGVLSGTPVAAGAYTFTVQVKDSQATPATASRQLTLTVGTTLATGVNNAMLSGSYAFLVNGFMAGNASGKVYGFASVGSLTFAAGAVTGVEDTNTTTGAQQAVTVSGTYTLGADNRGLLVMTSGTTTSVFAIAASNLVGGVAQTIAFTEFDNASTTGNTGGGFAKHQTAAAFTVATVKGTFAFGLSGESPCSTCTTPAPRFGPVAAAGVFTGDGTATLSAGQEDAAAYATNYTGVTLAGSFTTPSATNGRGTLKLTPTGTLFAAPPTNYTYVVVSASEVLLLSTDSHATTTLLYGDAQLQQQAMFSAASFTGRSIAYESQGSGGDGATTLPTGLNAILTELTNTGSGTATIAQDANRAGTFTTTAATAITYTTASNGRTAVTTGGATNQVLYLYNTGAGFALDQAGTSGYPGLAQYELQVATPPFPTLLSGAYGADTLATPAQATISSGVETFALSTGGVNSFINGTIATTTDSSSAAGTLTLGQTASLLFIEDSTGREVVSTTTSTTPTAIVYAITPKRAVSISAAAGAGPTVTVLQQ